MFLVCCRGAGLGKPSLLVCPTDSANSKTKSSPIVPLTTFTEIFTGAKANYRTWHFPPQTSSGMLVQPLVRIHFLES